MGKVDSGEMKVVSSGILQRKNPSANAPTLEEAPFNEEFVIVDVATNEQVVRCHRFLPPDKIPSARWLPDPKEINWRGNDYHQLSKQHPECAHCLAGISTWKKE